MPGGGARPNSGPKKGFKQKVKPPLDVSNPAVAEFVAMDAQARRANPDLKEGRDLLAQGANLMLGIVARCQRTPLDAQGVPVDAAIRATFFDCLARGMQYAHWVAPYQSPTFKAIMIAPSETAALPGDNAKLVNLRVFESGGKVVAVSED